MASGQLFLLAVVVLFAAQTAQAQMATGTYVGNGTSQSITGLGFRPDVVLVKVDHSVGSANDLAAVMKSATMSGANTKALHPGSALRTDLITSLDPDGFTVGSVLNVNASNSCGAGSDPCEYHWIAWKADADTKLGTYTGNGTTQSITGVGFSPEYLIVMAETALRPVHRNSLTGAWSTRFGPGGFSTDAITSLDADGFSLGDSVAEPANHPNASGVSYHYVAWNEVAGQMDVGIYPGDDSNDRNIIGVGFQPEVVIVQAYDDSKDGRIKSNTMTLGASDDASMNFRGGLVSNSIQALITDGFQIGSNTLVNDGAINYFYAAFNLFPPVFYSVGTDTSDLKTASPVITISSGVATLDVAQTRDIGVGDVIDYAGGPVYIFEVVSPTVFRVQTATGGLPTDVPGPGVSVTSIKRAFNSIAQAVTESSDGSHLGTTDLVAAARKLTWVVYNDSPFIVTGSTTISGYNTDAGHFITITVARAAQTANGVSQRHIGVAGTGALMDGSSLEPFGLDIQDDFTRVDGLELARFFDPLVNGSAAIRVEAANVLLENLLVYDFLSPMPFDHGIKTAPVGPPVSFTIRNSIIYDGDNDGIYISGASDVVTVENCTFYDVDNGVRNDGTVTVTNTISIANVVSFLNNNVMMGSNNMSNDATAPGPGSITGVAAINQFVGISAGAENLHLRGGADAIDSGIDLSVRFGDDIDGNARPQGALWDMGADESFFSGATTYYRSIGTAANLVNQGTITVTAGSATVTKTGGLGWLAENRGRGDVLIVNGSDEYMILGVGSDDVLALASLPVTSYTGGIYTIARQFTTLADWETCIDGNPCAFFPVASPSLVADNRREIGIAYKESAFTSAGGVPIVRLLGSTTDEFHDITLTADGVNRHFGIVGDGVVLDMLAELGSNAVRIQDEFVTVEWLEITGGAGMDGFEVSGVISPSQITLRYNLIHDIANGDGMQLRDADLTVDVYNNIIYGANKAIEFNQEVPTSARILNNTIYDSDEGVFADDVGCPGCKFDSVLLQNNIAHTFTGPAYFVPSTSSTGFATDASSNNLASDGTGTTHSAAGGGINSVAYASMNFVSATDLHITSGSAAEDQAVDLSSIFNFDIDRGLRQTPWDIGADDIAATTAVKLVSFASAGVDGAVELTWETATELDNVGFHLYRATSPEGPLQRVTAQVIPGLGSSPAGASYRYVDDGLVNGVTYYYELEDIETTGRTERHGPVSATPLAGVTTTESSSTRITYGEPEANELRIVKRTDRVVVLELVTRGFYAEPLEDGTVEVTVPDYLASEEASVPVKRFWLELPFEREVKRVHVVEREIERFSGLTPAGLSAELVAERDGTVRATRRRRRARGKLLPERAARVVSQGFQGAEHKALLELAPLRWNQELVLSQRLVVRVVLGKRKLPRARAQGRASWRLVTQEPGLYAVRHRGRQVRLSRQGETVPYHREGTTLYFLGEKDAVYELSKKPGAAMDVVDGTPAGPVLPYFWHTERLEENRYYQAALVNAPDIWLWDYLLAPMEKSFSFAVTGLASSEPATLRVWLQGASDLAHHVRFLVNGAFVGEARWDGKRDIVFEAETALGDGANELTLESVGAAYSMVMLNRFEVAYPGRSIGELEGAWETGTAEVSGLDAAYVLEVGGENPRWVRGLESGENRVRFRTEEGKRYLVAARAMAPEILRVRRANLLKKTRRAQWILIGPEAFLGEAQPLVQLRMAQGLRARAVSIESIYDEFGYGEPRPEAIRDFLRAVYHKTGSLKYVVLLGDGTFDFEDYLGTGVQNQVPPMMVKTSYLWTASDPAYAAVNGDDLLPDIAIGRLPAASVFEARTMVRKILAYERGEMSLLDGPVVLIADNPDRAGDFVADAEALASGLLSDKTTTKLFLPDATRQDVIQAFDEGASLMTYLGHGAIHLWADENLFNNNDVASLSSQSHQPLLLTMNCLNGYFHFPYFDSLAETLLKAEDKGVIAAFSPSGLSLNEPAKRYQEALVDELFHGGHQRLGDAVLEAQKRYAETGAFPELLAIYHLFGDPALSIR